VIFLIQFLLLSLIFGIPLLTLFASLGQYLGSGLIDMWRISPIFLVREFQLLFLWSLKIVGQVFTMEIIRVTFIVNELHCTYSKLLGFN